MRLNVRGQACHGLLTLAVDGREIVPGLRSTAPDWLEDGVAICQVEDGPRWVLNACDIATGGLRLLDGEPATTVAASGAGVWAAWRSTGIRSNVHPAIPLAGLWGVGRDGALGYARLQQQGTGIVFRSTSGSESEAFAGIPLRDVHIVAYGVAAAVSRGLLRTVGTPAAVTVPEEVFGPRLLQRRRSGEWWVLYHTQDRLLLHPLTSPIGYIVTTPGLPTYEPDFVELASGLIRVVWSTTAGAGPAAYRVRDIDLASARTPLTPQPPHPPPQPPPIEEPPRVTIASYEPRRGPAPLVVTAIRQLSGGLATRLLWRQRLQGDPKWIQVASNPASDPDHHFNFPTPGTYEIGVDVTGPGGSDGTVTPRIVEVLTMSDHTYASDDPKSGETIPKLTHQQVLDALNAVDAAYQELLYRAPDRDGQAAYERDLLNGDMTVAAMRANIMRSDEYKEKHKPKPPQPIVTVPTLHPDGRIFRTSENVPWRWKGVSAFALLDRFAKGQDLTPFLDAYRGFNILRVWPYVDWSSNGWGYPTPPTVDVIKSFLRHVAERGWLVELTLLTNDEPSMLEWAKTLIPQLAADPRPTNLLLEGGNEPTTHKNIDTKALKPALDASGFVYASGNYEDSTKVFGEFGVAHTPRDSEWPRKAHDLMEYYNGGGPHAPSDPAHRFPWSGDEPAKTQDVAPPAAPLTKRDDWLAYFGTAALLGCGATFHSETGKYASVPTSDEASLIVAALEALDAFPADAPNGPYSRPVENSLRTYCVGNCMVRVRPTTTTPPSGGWKPTGSSSILYRK